MEQMAELSVKRESGCFDAGTDQCPCVLALTGDCLICSRLQGKDVCDCDWNGICPYTVFCQNGNEIVSPREEVTAELVERTDYSEEISVFVFRVGRSFAQSATLPGSFVFLRPIGFERYCDIPVSVMKADEKEGTIHLAIRREGPKSKQLTQKAELVGTTCIIRGVYRSGLLGTEALKPTDLKGKKILLITKGIGAAPAMLIIDRLLTMNEKAGIPGAEIRWLADSEKVDRRLLKDYGRDVAPEYISLSSLVESEELLTEILKEEQPDVTALMVSEYYMEQLIRVIRKELPRTKIVRLNNAKMCCGEGLCGACTEIGPDGSVIRRCKCRDENGPMD
ncbi:MAG: hypothetical protein IJ486_06790 [Firmicutes bacterium]|nr:hypothetical protein [Bacillota bacterium]